MLVIEQTYLINASPERVWEGLTDPVIMQKWSGGPAQFDARLGGNYSLFGDYVTGQIIEFSPPTHLAQTWKPGDWTITDSVVSFTLTRSPKGTLIELVHENVQPEDYEGTSTGWNDFYVGSLKRLLEAEKPKAARRAAPKKKAPAKKAVTKKTAAKVAPKKKASATAQHKPVPKAKPAASKKKKSVAKRTTAKKK